jgi:prepilin-type N-terminal cleavage/methylation domain-containing protein
MNDRITKRYTGNPAAFTLIEIMIAVLLIGMAIAALVVANGAFSQANGIGIDLSTAEFLIEEIRELTMPLPVVDPTDGTAAWGPETGETAIANYDDLDDFDNITISPPIDMSRNPLNDLASFAQQIVVENVDPTALDTVVTDHSSDFVRVTVTIIQNNNSISSASWIRARY